jgi:hypothetical protein
MAQANFGGYDQLSAALAETFREYVDDNVFISNMVFQRGWQDAEKVDQGRFLSLPILTGKNQTAQSFGQYDEVNSSPQSTLSVAAFPWSFYQAAVMLDYQTLSLNRGPNVRVNLIAQQLQTAIASLADVCGQDLCQFPGGTPSLGQKAPGTTNAQPALGIVEATDDGTVVATYGNIGRTGASAFANWGGNRLAKLTQAGIGTATNDAPPSLFYALYNNSTQGMQVPTEVYTAKQGVASYMFSLQAQQRLSPGDIANVGFAGAKLFAADVIGDDHIILATGTTVTNLGANFFAINRNHTRFFYFGEKGFDFVPWIDAQTVIAKISRYVTAFQFCSSQPRTGGQLLNVNVVFNL